ncbi:MAG: segregation/condensation protein A [Candidatus Micrarchaeaceae archaeon]
MQFIEKEIVLQDTSSLERFVKEVTWKDVLFDLVRKNEIDPWDIDISKLVDNYLAAIRTIKLLDLKVPANIMLAAAILVRLKSDMLNMEEEQEQEAIEPEQLPQLCADVLLPRARLPPKRRITLAELIDALDEAIKMKDRREQHFAESMRAMPFALSFFDVETEAEAIYKTLKQHADSEGLMTFPQLCVVIPDKNPLLEIFIPLLFLAQSGRIDVFQERFFGELFIKIQKGKISWQKRERNTKT